MSKWGISPKQSVKAECLRRGTPAVIDGCVALLKGQSVDDDLHRALAGPASEPILRGEAGGLGGYWPRVWAARGLLYAWDSSAVPVVVAATQDEAWRVREMALKLISRHLIGDGLGAAVRLQTDPVPRVRNAAHRAVERLVEAGA